MTVKELLTRTRGQIGKNTIYGLGQGVSQGASPRGETGACDCSAFVCWALDLRKYQPKFGWLVKVNGGWYNTDGIWWDATKENTGFFSRITSPRPGAIVVFPSAATAMMPGPKIGHVGVVTAVGADGRYSVVHCSAGNFRAHGDAIQETASTVFERPATIFAWAAPVG